LITINKLILANTAVTNGRMVLASVGTKTVQLSPMIKILSIPQLTRCSLRKGYIILISGDPDFFIVPHVNAKDIIRVSQWGYQYGPDWAPSTQVIDAAFYDGNNLFLDIVDARSRTLIWRGVATEMNPANLTPEVVTETVRKAASEMFERFPPEQ
jgi:hypothetical protein